MALRLCVYLPMLVAAVIYALRDDMDAVVMPAAFGAGLLLWTPIEYLVHRYVFHALAPHYQHHTDPTDPKYILAPLWLTLPAALAICGLLAAATGSWATAAMVDAGVISGYLAYECAHLMIHSRLAGGRLLRALRRHHYYHHFADDQTCYGVTSPLWDAILGTATSGVRRTDP